MRKPEQARTSRQKMEFTNKEKSYVHRFVCTIPKSKPLSKDVILKSMKLVKSKD